MCTVVDMGLHLVLVVEAAIGIAAAGAAEDHGCAKMDLVQE